MNRALVEAAALLAEFPRPRHAVASAHARFQQFKTSHASVEARLITITRPGSDDAEYDILLKAPDGSVLTLCRHADEGIPWTTLYADHWASNLVLTVNGADITIQSALIYLNRVLNRRPDLMEDLVSRALVSTAIETSPVNIADDELDTAVKEFRVNNGLSSGAATQRWLDDMHLTMASLRDLVAENLRMRKFRQSVTAEHVRPYFARHGADFERLTIMRLDAVPQTAAQSLAARWRRSGHCPVVDAKYLAASEAAGTLQTLYARDAPPEFSGQPSGAVVGPVRAGRVFWIGQLLRRKPGRLDRPTRARIEQLLFAEWLAEQKRHATIRWHWV